MYFSFRFGHFCVVVWFRVPPGYMLRWPWTRQRHPIVTPIPAHFHSEIHVWGDWTLLYLDFGAKLISVLIFSRFSFSNIQTFPSVQSGLSFPLVATSRQLGSSPIDIKHLNNITSWGPRNSNATFLFFLFSMFSGVRVIPTSTNHYKAFNIGRSRPSVQPIYLSPVLRRTNSLVYFAETNKHLVYILYMLCLYRCWSGKCEKKEKKM